MTGQDTDVHPLPRSEDVLPRPRSPVVLQAVMAAEGVILAALTGLGGSPGWRVTRALVVVAVAALAVWFTRRTSRVGQGTTALLLGITGTVAGAGIASAHLAKAGLDAAAVMAAVVLVTGLFLLGWGAAALVRAVPGWWRLLAVPTALALMQFVLLPLTVAVNATNRPPGLLGVGSPASYGFAYQDVAFSTADGVRLSAWYIPARNGAAVVLLPGAGATRTAMLGQAAVLARHGYGALLVDTRGHGRSAGHAMDFGWWGDRDLAAAVSVLARQAGVQAGKIAVLGESMGGEQALAAAAPDRRIRAVVAEGAEGQQLADYGWRPHDITGILDRGMEWVQYAAAGLLSGAHRPMSIRDGIRAAHRPILIIAGGASAGEPAAARWFQAASLATVQVWIVPNARHTQGLAIAPQAWEAHVISFLNTALKPRP
jgi:alpha-beta hydrolase superfamily lysophospholipase